MALKDTINSMKKLLGEITRDIDKSLWGNKTASQRVRVNTIKLEKVSKTYRKESVSTERKASGKSLSKSSSMKRSSAKRATAKVLKKKR